MEKCSRIRLESAMVMIYFHELPAHIQGLQHFKCGMSNVIRHQPNVISTGTMSCTYHKALRKVPVKFWDVTKYGRQVGAFCDIRDERFRRAQLVGLLVSVPDFSVLIASPHC